MMALFRYLNVLSWPIWVKLLAGFALAIIVPALLIIVVIQASMTEINTGHIRVFVTENGARQQENISAALNQAAEQLRAFASQPGYRSEMIAATNETASDWQKTYVSVLFRNNLFDSGLFTNVRLLNGAGVIVAQSNSIDALPTGANDSASLTYMQAKDAFTAGTNFITTVQASGVIEFNHAVQNNGQVVGYLIGTLNTDRAILESLPLIGNVYDAYSYLVTGGRETVVFSLSQMRKVAVEAAVDSQAVAKAFVGSTQTDTYRIGKERQTTVVGFYGPILDPTHPDTPLFALVTEAKLTSSFAGSFTPLTGPRAFVTIIGSGLLLVLLILLFHQFIVPPVNQLRHAMQAITQGDFSVPITTARRQDEIGQLSSTFVDMRDQVQTLLNDLEARVTARVGYLDATREVSRFAATQRNLQTLLDEVVNLIVAHFNNVYHAQIFLLDDDGTYAILRASTGDVGKMLLQRGHRLAVGSLSVIGQVTQQGQVVVARDTASSEVHRSNEFLPYTRAELAIPLKIGDRLIGALDVQSKQRDAFTQDETTVLQTMADQLAVAIENARLYQESVRRMAEVERANREATRTTWQDYIYSLRQRSLTSEAGVPTGLELSDLRQRAVAEGRIVIGDVSPTGTIPIAVPIQLSGQILGAVEWEMPASYLDDNKLQLAQELANRLAISLDNARLFEESQRAAERERIVNTIAARLTPQTEINEILQTAVREVGQALRAPQVSIRLHHTNGKHEQK